MGNKKSTLSVDNAKLESVFGRCGIGSCRSSCCEENEEKDMSIDLQHKKMEVAIRVELAMVHKMVTDAMLACPDARVDVTRETDERITITIRPKKESTSAIQEA